MLFKNNNTYKHFRNGQIILPQGLSGPAMGLVEKGQVEIFQKCPDGEETVFRVMGPNETFGIDSLFNDQKRNTGARALGDAQVSIMDRRDFIRRLHKDPQVAFNVLQSVCRRIKEMSEKL